MFCGRSVGVIVAVLTGLPGAALGAGTVAGPTWEIITEAALQQQVTGWLERATDDDRARRRALAAWSEPPGEPDRLERLARTFAAVLPDAEQLLRHCRDASEPLPEQAARWLEEETLPDFVRANLRLYYGRWLARHEYYDASLEQLEGLTVQQVADPVALLFYRGVDDYALVRPKQCRKEMEMLLEREPDLPRRYGHLARLMFDDLEGLKTDSLDEIARRMGDVRRRLGLGQADRKVRQIEDGIIASLDKKIKELEEQQQQQQSGGASGRSDGQRPAQESRIMAGRGPGKVHRKDIGHKADWGNLPPKQREEALQQIGRQFPSYYRDVIEQYFKKLAQEDAAKR